MRRWRANGGFDYFDGAHDGYRPLVHRRHVLALHGDLLIVADLVSGPDSHGAPPHAAAVHWHIDPRWQVELTDNGVRLKGVEGASLHTSHGTIARFDADPVAGLGWHAPVYGRLEPATTIRVTQSGATPLWIVSVFGLNPANGVSSVATLPVWAEAGVLVHSIAVRITRASSIDYLVLAEPVGDENPAAPAAGTSDSRVGTVQTWRVAEFETDARMLFCRIADDQQVTRVALVDGSIVRSSSKRGVELALPAVVPDLHLDMHGIRTSGTFECAEARVAGPAFGVTLSIGGVERSLAGERRLTPRAALRISNRDHTLRT